MAATRRTAGSSGGCKRTRAGAIGCIEGKGQQINVARLLLSGNGESIISSNKDPALGAKVLTLEDIAELWIIFTVEILAFCLGLRSLETLIVSQMFRGWVSNQHKSQSLTPQIPKSW